MADNRCVLRRDTGESLDATTDLNILVSKLHGALYRATRVRAWAQCEPYPNPWQAEDYVEPTNEQVDAWLEDLNRLTSEAHSMLGNVRLGG